MFKFIQTNFRWIAGGFLLTFLSSFGQTFFISASAAEWQAAFGLSHGAFGQLYMAATLSSALCLPFLGKLVDVMPEHRVLMLVIPVLALATAMAAFAPSVIVLVIAIFLLRLFGQGMMTHTALTATGRWFAVQRGRAVSLVVLGHQAGEATLPLAFATLALAFGFQAGWVGGTLVLVLIGLPLSVWAFSKPRSVVGKSDGAQFSAPAGIDGRHWTRVQVIRDPVFWLLLSGVLAPPFIGTTFFFHQNYLTNLNQWPADLFARGLAVMAFCTVIFALINGAIIDRFGAAKILPVFLLPLAAACLVLGSVGSAPMLFVFMILLGMSYGLSSTLFGALWPEIYGSDHLGAVRALIVSASVLATAVGPGLTGTLIDGGLDLPVQMRFLGGYCIVISGLMMVAQRKLAARTLPKAHR